MRAGKKYHLIVATGKGDSPHPLAPPPPPPAPYHRPKFAVVDDIYIPFSFLTFH